MNDYKDYSYENSDIDETYYDGFEGESEYVFILKLPKEEKQVGIWDGYVDDIMDQIKPVNGRQTAFALEYQVDASYMLSNDPWLIPDLKGTYEQFKGVVSSTFRFEETSEVLALLLDMMEKALKENGKLYIYYC